MRCPLPRMSVHFKIGIRTLKKGPKRVSGVCSVKIAKKKLLLSIKNISCCDWSSVEPKGGYTFFPLLLHAIRRVHIRTL